MSNYYGPNRGDYRSGASWIVWAMVMLIVLVVGGFAVRWAMVPARLYGPERMERLSRQANDSWQALEAQRRNIAATEDKARQMTLAYGEDMTNWPQGKRDEYLQLRQQVTNLTTAYNNACGQYQAMWADEWRDIPAPDDLPTTCEMR